MFSYFKSVIATLVILFSLGFAQNTFSIEVGDGTIDVLYNSDADIAGFQFDIEGATINGASGGDAVANGFMVSNSPTTIIGFSLTGSVIPAGSGTLVVVSADITGDISLTGIVVSDPNFIAYNIIYGNSADEGGGGIYASHGYASDTLIYNLIINNTSSKGGGANWQFGGTILNNVFAENYSSSNGNGGGAIYFTEDQSLEVKYNSFYKNRTISNKVLKQIRIYD